MSKEMRRVRVLVGREWIYKDIEVELTTEELPGGRVERAKVLSMEDSELQPLPKDQVMTSQGIVKVPDKKSLVESEVYSPEEAAERNEMRPAPKRSRKKTK